MKKVAKWMEYYHLVLILVLIVMSIAVLRSYSPPSSVQEFSLSIAQHGSNRRKEGKYDSDWNRMAIQANGLSGTFGADMGVLEMERSSGLPGLPFHSGISKLQLFAKGKPVKLITPSNPNMLVPASQSMVEDTKLFIPFYFVHGNFVKSSNEIFSSSWLIRLQEMLGSLHDPSKPVSVVFSDSEYVDSLLNWLIASQVKIEPPLRNLIVVCLDKIVFSMLDHRDISSILIDPAMILNTNAVEDTKKKHSHIWIVRLVVYRMITYFGYDVMSYDTDAILMKNLQPLFEKYQDSDIVGSAGSYPFDLGRLWGFTACMGAILFRSRPNSEFIWELMSKSKLDSFDDQVRLNFALKKCGIKWQNTSSSISKSPISGQCFLPPYQGLKVTILPYSDICRQCKKNQDYFVVHLLSKKKGTAKVAIAMGTDWWSLRKDWRKFSLAGDGGLKGIKWLATLSNHSAHGVVLENRRKVIDVH